MEEFEPSDRVWKGEGGGDSDIHAEVKNYKSKSNLLRLRVNIVISNCWILLSWVQQNNYCQFVYFISNNYRDSNNEYIKVNKSKFVIHLKSKTVMKMIMMIMVK